jgi:Protein of unknown function (DUF1573)
MHRRMVVILGALTFVIAVAGLVVAQEASKTGAPKKVAASGPQPIIEIPKMRHDFGEVYEADKFEYTFIVKNKGKADLVIQDVKPGCGCTVANFDKVIPPGGEGSIELVLDGTRVHGDFSKTAQVHSNDPEHPELTLTIAGKKVALVNVVPDGVIYLQGRYEEVIEKEVTISSNEKLPDFKVLGATSDIDDKISYEVKPGLKKGDYVLKVKKNPELPMSSSYGTITVKTNSAKAPETKVQVQVMTKGNITVSPSSVNFGNVPFAAKDKTAAPVTRTIMVIKNSGDGLDLKDVKIDNPNFKAKVESVTPGKQFKVEITFQPPQKRNVVQRETGELIINTNDPREPMVRVHVVAKAI